MLCARTIRHAVNPALLWRKATATGPLRHPRDFLGGSDTQARVGQACTWLSKHWQSPAKLASLFEVGRPESPSAPVRLVFAGSRERLVAVFCRAKGDDLVPADANHF